jgi:hypothetical protein
LYKLLITYFLALFPLLIFGQETERRLYRPDVSFLDTTKIQPALQDSLYNYQFGADTLSTDTIRMNQPDSLRREKPPVIEAPIDYNAEDSIIGSFDGQKVYLYNNARVTYQQIELTAYFIELDLETKEV